MVTAENRVPKQPAEDGVGAPPPAACFLLMVLELNQGLCLCSATPPALLLFCVLGQGLADSPRLSSHLGPFCLGLPEPWDDRLR